MALKREIYRALEDVVGPENISEDPLISYAYVPLRTRMEEITGVAMPRFDAVTLPKDTKEIQAIVRLCNRYKIQYKASSTGWGYGDPSAPGVIKLDLRRMNRILEINEKNMYVVVEPYVIYAQLQAELMKRGLNCNITGAGSNCSALPIAAHSNLGHLSISGSYGERNQLALEWVTPDGEIVRMGSLGALGEWFCGDGPGPSLRGIIRGNVVPLGGLGVFTRAAQKVYHWPGPPTFPMEGIAPHYTPSEIPPGFLIRYFSFPSIELLEEAVCKVGESEIGFILMGFNISMLTANLAESNDEDLKYMKQYADLVQGPGFLLIVAGDSPRDFEYKKKALQQIVDEYKGKSLEPVEDPRNAGGFMWRFIRVTASIREVFRATGVFGGMVSGTDVFPLMSKYIQYGASVKEGFIKKGSIHADSTEPFVQSIEHGHCGHGELLMRFFLNNRASLEAQMGLTAEANRIAIEGHFGVGHGVRGDAAHDQYGPHTSNYHLWLRKIKKTFDPNATSDAGGYITAKE